MSNQFLNAQEYANVMLLLLKDQLVFGRLVDGQYKDQVTDENGLTINVKRPPRFVDSKDGTAALVPQDLVTGTMPVTVDQYSKVHIAIGDIEYVQSFNALMKNESMKSAASTLAHSLDKFVASQTLKFHSWVAGQVASSGGSTNAYDPTKGIASSAEAMGAHTRLMANGCPNSDICGVATFLDAEMIRGSLLSSFTPTLNRTALEKVKIPLISEIDWYATQMLPSITTGTRTQGDGSSTGSAISGANQNVNYRDVKGSAGTAGMTQNLTISMTTGQTVVAGEVFTIEGVYAWDWRAQQALPDLAQFTVLANATAASSLVTLSIQPAIIVQGTSDGTATNPTAANTAFATVDSIPASGTAYVKFAGAASTKLTVRAAFNKRAISLVSARLQMPFTGVASYAVDPDTGIALRYWRGSDIVSGAHIHRWDCMYGATVMDSFLGTKVCGT